MPDPSAGSVNPNLEAALYHARAGRPVFPCSPEDKKPAIAKKEGGNGFKDATTDEARVRAWWARYPNAVPGMPTGQRVGVWVLDVDTKPGKVGRESLARLVEAFGPLPDTVETLTATGGSHLFFRHPRDGRLVPNSASQLGLGTETWGRGGYPAVPFEVLPSGRLRVPDLDVRGDGGYVILPGSVMADGRRYEWEGSSDPDEGAEVADAPDWLLALVARDPNAEMPFGARNRYERQSSAESFFPRVNAKAMAALPAWVPTLFPAAKPYHDGFRVSSSALGRNLEEDISLLPIGIRDFGEEEGKTPIDLVLEWGAPANPLAAALWLCERLGVDPVALGLGNEDERRRQERQRDRKPTSAQADGNATAPAGGDPPPGGPALRVVGGTEHDPRPLIQIRNGELPQVVDDAEFYLIEDKTDIFQHGTRLVRVGRWDQSPVAQWSGDAGRRPLTRPHGSGVLIDVSAEWLADTMTRQIRWERWDERKNKFKTVDCPTKVATTLLARVGSWSFPGLVGFCDSPTLDHAGRVVSAPGYDAPSGLYLSHPPAIEPIVTTDRFLAERGVEILSEAVETFPFVTECDRAACLALVLTALLRRVLPSAPIGGVSANTPGTGKSKLVDVVSAISTGRAAAVVGIGSTPEELEKRVDSILIKGDALASFDNVDRPVKSDVLCQVATQGVKSIRVMGLSKIVEAPTNVCLLMTGNNLTLVGDLVRRVVLVNLDAKCERPELRTFARDAVEYVLERRGELIRAALVIAKAYLDAGCPVVDAPPFGSFEAWDRMVRRPLIWAGCPDPLRPAEAMRDQDHELVGMRDLLREWEQLHRPPITAADLSEAVRSRVPLMGEGWAAEFPGLQDAAIQVMGDLGKWGPRELGYRLRAMAGRLFDGRRVVKADKGRGGVQWLVECVE